MTIPIPQTRCPVVHVDDITPCPPEEVEPLLTYLRSGQPAPAADATFPRGTALPDGRLDLCKQSLGAQNAARVLSAVAHCPSVRHILLGTDGLGDEGARALGESVAASAHLETVYLGCNAITHQGAAHLAEGLAHNQSVRALWLKRNPLGPRGAEAIARLVLTHDRLEVLDLVNTALGDEGALLIADALARSRRLTWLYLGGNGITAVGARALARAASDHPTLRGLYLAANRLGDQGAAHLASLGRLERLSLASNRIGPEGAGVLFEALAAGASWLELDLGWAIGTDALGEQGNALGDPGAYRAAEALGADPPLRRLDLRRNGLTSQAGLAIERAVGHNHHLARLILGKGISRRIKRRIRARLAANAVGAVSPPAHLQAIQSVYRQVPLGPLR